MAEKENDAVGYKRPPQHTRFRSGVSGNPKGRAKGMRNFETDLKEELAERIAVREGERSLKISKQRALLKAMMAKALKGDTKAAGLVLQLLAKLVPEAESNALGDQPLDDDSRDIIERFLARRTAKPDITQ